VVAIVDVPDAVVAGDSAGVEVVVSAALWPTLSWYDPQAAHRWADTQRRRLKIALQLMQDRLWTLATTMTRVQSPLSQQLQNATKRAICLERL